MNIASPAFRDMQAYDLQSVIALGETIYQFACTKHLTKQKELLLREFLRWSEQKKAECVVLEDPDSFQILGYFLLILCPECIDSFWKVPDSQRGTTAYLAQIVIHEELQDLGIGSNMLTEIENRALFHGKTRLRLEVASHNPAYQWYLKRDFAVLGSQHFMEKSLEAS